jgi:phospholipase/carboxylesterase
METETMSTGPQKLSLVHQAVGPRIPPTDGAMPPLLVLLHGVGSNEMDLLGLAHDLDGRFQVVSARAPLTLGPMAHAWYHIDWTADGPVGNDAEADASRDHILRFIAEATAAYGTDPARTYLMGFSQGAIMSLFVALTRPQAVRAIVPMSGRLLPQALIERAPDDALAGLPIFAVHGTRDSVLPIANGREIRDELSRLPVDLAYREYDMAHEVSYESLRDISAWLTAQLA